MVSGWQPVSTTARAALALRVMAACDASEPPAFHADDAPPRDRAGPLDERDERDADDAATDGAGCAVVTACLDDAASAALNACEDACFVNPDAR